MVRVRKRSRVAVIVVVRRSGPRILLRRLLLKLCLIDIIFFWGVHNLCYESNYASIELICMSGMYVIIAVLLLLKHHQQLVWVVSRTQIAAQKVAALKEAQRICKGGAVPTNPASRQQPRIEVISKH